MKISILNQENSRSSYMYEVKGIAISDFDNWPNSIDLEIKLSELVAIVQSLEPVRFTDAPLIEANPAEINNQHIDTAPQVAIEDLKESSIVDKEDISSKEESTGQLYNAAEASSTVVQIATSAISPIRNGEDANFVDVVPFLPPHIIRKLERAEGLTDNSFTANISKKFLLLKVVEEVCHNHRPHNVYRVRIYE